MIFKIRTVNQVVLIVSIISAILDTIVAIMHKTPWWAWPLTTVCTFLITYYLTRFLLQQYVVFRIKPLYQLLLSKDIATSRQSKALRERVEDDVVDDIQEGFDQLVSLSENEIERILQKERERSEFLETVSHEIRTPVFNIQGYAQTLLDGALQDPNVNIKYVERIVRSVDRLAEIVEDIDKLSFYESGGIVLYKDLFDIALLSHEMIDTNIVNAKTRNITCKVDYATFPANQPIWVCADRFRIAQVLNNLIMNAIQFGKQHGNVIISFVDMFDKILIEVTDDGIGIPAKELPRVFERLYRVDKSRTRNDGGGSGLGLTSVKMIIDAHQENITVRSEEGVGTTFSFTLVKSQTKKK